MVKVRSCVHRIDPFRSPLARVETARQSESSAKFYNSSNLDVPTLTLGVLKFDRAESFWLPRGLAKCMFNPLPENEAPTPGAFVVITPQHQCPLLLSFYINICRCHSVCPRACATACVCVCVCVCALYE